MINHLLGRCLLVVGLLVPGWLHAADKKPNILFIVADDLGYNDLGFQGCKDVPTPNIDALAVSGVRFSNGYVSGPYCSPTRAGLLTGRYQTRFGHEFNPGGGNAGLPLSESTIADRLKAHGYRTALMGKWHLGSNPDMVPQKRGFDEFFGFLGGAHSYFDRSGILRGNEPVNNLGYTTDAFGAEAADFVGKNHGKPWFLYLAFNAVHTPMHATDSRLEKFKYIRDERRRTYNAMLLAMDEAIGVVMAKLKSTGQEKDTLVTFISDNGGPTMVGVTVNGSRNEPLRGSKRTTLEGGVRVPFVVSWPGKIKPAQYDSPVIQLDLHATALAAAGLAEKPEWKLEGVNLLPYLSGEKTGVPHEALYWRFGNQNAIRVGDYKLVTYDAAAEGKTGGKNVIGPRLYNLAKDIHEDNDLSKSMPEKVNELQAKWNAWDKLNVKPKWGAETKAGGGKAKKKKGSDD